MLTLAGHREKGHRRNCRSSPSSSSHAYCCLFSKSEVPFVCRVSRSREEIAYGRSPLSLVLGDTSLSPCYILFEAERYRLDCIIIKRDKDRSRGKEVVDHSGRRAFDSAYNLRSGLPLFLLLCGICVLSSSSGQFASARNSRLIASREVTGILIPNRLS